MAVDLQALKVKITLDQNNLYALRDSLRRFLRGEHRKLIEEWADAAENVMVREYDITRMAQEAEDCPPNSRGDQARAYYRDMVTKLTGEIPPYKVKAEELAAVIRSGLQAAGVKEQLL